MDAAFAEPLVFFASSNANTTVTTPTMSGLQRSLPPNVMLLTLKPVKNHGDRWMVRLAHQYSGGEDDVLCQQATVNLETLFNDWSIIDVIEMTLTGNQKLSDAKRIDWTGKGSVSKRISMDGDLNIALDPMDVRTLVVTVKPREVATL